MRRTSQVSKQVKKRVRLISNSQKNKQVTHKVVYKAGLSRLAGLKQFVYSNKFKCLASSAIIFSSIIINVATHTDIKTNSVKTPVVDALSIDLPKTAIIKPTSKNLKPIPTVSAKAFIVYDVKSDTALASASATTRMLPASTTKIITALVAMDEYHLNDVVTIASVVNSGQVIGLVNGEQITVENLLYGMLIQSGNDAAFALADFHPRGRGYFISLMNQKVINMGLSDTHFANPAGFDDPEQYSTALDLVHIGIYAMSHPTFARIVGTAKSEIYSEDQKTAHPLTNVNELLGQLPGVRGIKTGYTESAGENLVTDILRGNIEIVTVVLGSSQRFEDTKNLVEWAYSNFSWE